MTKKKDFLEGHKKVGKKLIPPMLQLPNMVMTSFRDEGLPDLIWLAPFFLRVNDDVAVQQIMEFLVTCNDTLNHHEAPSLAFLSNFNKLSNIQKQSLIDGLATKPILSLILDKIKHHNCLFHDYPLKFLFAGLNQEIEREQCITFLEEDVDALLDRNSQIATKIHVTTIVSMMVTGKMFITSEIDIPNFNSIFTDPDSEEAKRAASFARANLNAGIGFSSVEATTNTWPNSFWKQSFSFSGCR